MNIELSETENRLLALALHGLAMRQGPLVFDRILALADKLELKEILEEYSESWIAYGSTKEANR